MVERRPIVLIRLLVSLLLMALTSFLPTTANTDQHHHHHHRKRKKQPPPPPTKPPTPSSWEQLKSLLSCRSTPPSLVHDPSAAPTATRKQAKMGSTCGSSICALRDVVHGNTRVVHRSDNDHHSASSRSDTDPHASSETAPLASSARHHPPPHSRGGMQLRKLSGCYECHAISVEPLSRYPRPRTLCACSYCGEVFTKPEGLELHQTLRHSVSELGPEDSGRNIVEIIFKSSWQKKDHPICMIERILKVHNTQRTVARFEDYRDSVKSRALPHLAPASSSAAAGSAARNQLHKKNPRCAADGNELLRFHCTTLSCALGALGSTALCISASASASASCGVCSVIRHGFARAPQGHHPHGVPTTASSGRAHDCGPPSPDGGGRRAMLVCRVIAGRIRRASDDSMEEEVGGGGWYDSVAGREGGQCANLEELFVSNPRAILPCFVVIYRALD